MKLMRRIKQNSVLFNFDNFIIIQHHLTVSHFDLRNGVNKINTTVKIFDSKPLKPKTVSICVTIHFVFGLLFE